MKESSTGSTLKSYSWVNLHPVERINYSDRRKMRPAVECIRENRYSLPANNRSGWSSSFRFSEHIRHSRVIYSLTESDRQATLADTHSDSKDPTDGISLFYSILFSIHERNRHRIKCLVLLSDVFNFWTNTLDDDEEEEEEKKTNFLAHERMQRE
jgi:hypothetical protein